MQKTRPKVLFYGRSERFLESLPHSIGGLDVDCLVAPDSEGARALLSYHTCAVLIAMVRSAEFGGSHDLSLLRAVKSANPGLHIIAIPIQVETEHRELSKFIVEHHAVVSIREENPGPMLEKFLEDIIGVSRKAAGQQESSVVRLAPLTDHINSGCMTAHFQPIVDLSSNRVHAYEALARSKEGGLLNHPGVLFEYSANKNMFVEIDYICTQAALRESAGKFDDQMLFLNVQPRSLADVNFAEVLKHNVEKVGRKPSSVCVELTEQEGVKNVRLFETSLKQLRDHAFRIALDDFGEGNANFELLMQVNPNVVKISGQLVNELESRKTARAMLKSLTSLCHELGIETVAEFIETESQCQILSEFGVTYGQGWHLGRPSPVNEL